MRTIVAAVVFVVTASPLLLAQWPKYTLPGTPKAADGKVNLGASNLDYTPPLESRNGDPALRERFPLEMVSSKNDDSTLTGFRTGSPARH